MPEPFEPAIEPVVMCSVVAIRPFGSPLLALIVATTLGACGDDQASGDDGPLDSGSADAGRDTPLPDVSEIGTGGDDATIGDSSTGEDWSTGDDTTTTPDSVIGDTSIPPDDAGDDSSASACLVCSEQRRPLVLVHGIDGSPANFEVMIERLIEDGWAQEDIVAFEAEDPSWGCNVDNAAAIDALVDSLLEETCQPRVDLVAHSMGTLSSRYFMKFLGGHERVNTYVTLGGMHHGLTTPCFAPDFLGICVWTELCESGDYIAALNADPPTPGESHWVSIYGTADDVVPNDSSHLDGAENIVIEGAEHDGPNGLLQRADAYEEVLRVLGYPCW